jgi:hypothetical protein
MLTKPGNGGEAADFKRAITFCVVQKSGRLKDLGSIPGRGGAGILSLRHRFQTGCGTHSASYKMGTGSSFPGSKATGV